MAALRCAAPHHVLLRGASFLRGGALVHAASPAYRRPCEPLTGRSSAGGCAAPLGSRNLDGDGKVPVNAQASHLLAPEPRAPVSASALARPRTASAAQWCELARSTEDSSYLCRSRPKFNPMPVFRGVTGYSIGSHLRKSLAAPGCVGVGTGCRDLRCFAEHADQGIMTASRRELGRGVPPERRRCACALQRPTGAARNPAPELVDG